MKKTILYSAMALATLTMSSCGDDFLLLDPAGSVSEATLASDDGINMVLTGAYSSFNSMTQTGWMGYASLFNYVYGDVVGGDANKGSQSTDQSDFTALETYAFSSSNSYIAGKWNGIYEAVKRANNVLSLTNRNAESISNKDLVDAQARFIKAVWMFEGIKMFGPAIPYVDLESYDASTDPQVGNVDESGNLVNIWNLVEEDLKFAVNNLPADWKSTGDYGRATSWMAKAVLAKLYLYWSSPYNGNMGTADHWNDAKTLLDDIIANGVDAKGQKYKLIDKYGDLWVASADDCDWGGEGVFDVQLTISGTQTDTNAIISTPAAGQPGASGVGGWGFYQPSYDFVNSMIVDANGLPLSTSEYRALPQLTQLRTNADKSVTPVTDLSVAVDPRLDFSVGRFNVPYLDWGTPTELNGWVRDYTNGGLYMNKKPEPYISDRSSGLSIGTTSTSSAKNYHVIRYADILLMRAEVAIHESDLSTALTYINQVRKRAANDFVENPGSGYTLDDQVNGDTKADAAGNYRIGLYTSFANATEATTALRAERRAELALEGHRWFDLARWGVAADVLNDYVTYEGASFPGKYKSYGKNWVTFPIPYTQIVNGKGRIKQNLDWQ